jgi:hypothetical protein
LRVGGLDPGHCPEQDVRGLEWLDASCEQQHVRVLRNAERCPIGRPRRERAQIDARRHDVDARRIGLVVSDELVRLAARGRDEPVCLGHDLLLADDA